MKLFCINFGNNITEIKTHHPVFCFQNVKIKEIHYLKKYNLIYF